MSIPKIPTQQIIPTSQVDQFPEYQGLRIVRCQSDSDAEERFNANAYQFQHEPEKYTRLRATLCRKGVVESEKYCRLSVTAHPNLQQFTDLVQYDPKNPPAKDYSAFEMDAAHKRTQSDFKGAKSKNTVDFTSYLIEGIKEERPLYLPTVSGWQSTKVFDGTVFVAFDEQDPDAMYGLLYLPKAPVMQSDGQTQSASLFSVARSKEAIEAGALAKLRVTLEIELNVRPDQAGQSFADRNGRGVKKNSSLVISLDTSSALSQLRVAAIDGTIFENRCADGRATGATLTATKNIADLSALEQILLHLTTGNRKKAEHFKQFHVDPFLPYAREFFQMLEDDFGDEWPEEMPPGVDTYRRTHVHGWPFALKAIALAYHRTRIEEIGPLAASIGAEEAGLTAEEAFLSSVDKKSREGIAPPPITFDELQRRLDAIDWVRHRKHWIEITGASEKDGKTLVTTLKTGETVVRAQAPNTAAVISKVVDRILSENWESLTSDENAPIPEAEPVLAS